jgi:hypothetical protein
VITQAPQTKGGGSRVGGAGEVAEQTNYSSGRGGYLLKLGVLVLISYFVGETILILFCMPVNPDLTYRELIINLALFLSTLFIVYPSFPSIYLAILYSGYAFSTDSRDVLSSSVAFPFFSFYSGY